MMNALSPCSLKSVPFRIRVAPIYRPFEWHLLRIQWWSSARVYDEELWCYVRVEWCLHLCILICISGARRIKQGFFWCAIMPVLVVFVLSVDAHSSGFGSLIHYLLSVKEICGILRTVDWWGRFLHVICARMFARIFTVHNIVPHWQLFFSMRFFTFEWLLWFIEGLSFGCLMKIGQLVV